MAGHMLSLVLQEHGHSVTPVARRGVPLDNLVLLDVQSPEFDKFLQTHVFDVVVNCVGVLNQFAEKDLARAIYLNSYFPHALAARFARTECKVVHISTDCVFSGKQGHYRETDTPDADTAYARTKALGEIKNDKDLTVRTSIIGPDLSPQGIGLLNWFLRQHGAVQGYEGAIWSGVTTLDLAHWLIKALERDITGLYHLTPGDSINKYQILCHFNHLFEKAIPITPVAEPRVDKSIVDTRQLLEVPGYRPMFEALADWTKARKHLYPHYFAEA